MSLFLKDILFVILAFLLFNVLFLKRITDKLVYDEYEATYYKKKELKKDSIYFFSDSHGWALTRNAPSIIEQFNEQGIYNMSYGSDSYGDILVKLKWLVDNDIKPKKIVLSVDDHMLLRKSNNRNRSLIYSNLQRHKETYGISTSKVLFYEISKYFPIIYPSNQRLIKKSFESLFATIDPDEKNFTWQELPDSLKLANAHSRASSLLSEKNENIIELNRINLSKILSFSNRNNIQVIGIKYPVSHEFLGIIESQGLKDNVLQEAQNLGLKTYISFDNKFNSPDLLSDQDHINLKGSQVLTKELMRVLNAN
jgi:hypothetical protein